MTKLWGGRFTKTAEEWVDAFGASIGFDQALVMEDIQGSLAHVTMLGKCGILSTDETNQIKAGLETLREKGFLKGNSCGIKILGNGTLTKKLTFQVEAISEGAKEKLKEAGIAI